MVLLVEEYVILATSILTGMPLARKSQKRTIHVIHGSYTCQIVRIVEAKPK